MIKIRDSRHWLASVAMCSLTTGVCGAFVDEYGYTAGGSLPQPPYELHGEHQADSAVVLDGTSLLITSNKGNAGATTGYVPSVIIDASSVGSAWSVTTTFSADWYGANKLDNAFPSIGMLLFAPDENASSGVGNQIRFMVKRRNGSAAETGAEYIELGYNSDNNIIGGSGQPSFFSSRVASSSPTPYTLTVTNDGSGAIQFTSSLAGMETVVTLNASSTGAALSAYNLLNDIGGKGIGLYVNGQTYTQLTNTLHLTGSFDSLAISGMGVVPEPAAMSAFVLLCGGILLKRRR